MTLSLFLNTATVMAKNIPEVGTTWGLRWVQWVCRLEWEVWLDKVWKMRSGWLGVSSSIRAQRTLVTGNANQHPGQLQRMPWYPESYWQSPRNNSADSALSQDSSLFKRPCDDACTRPDTCRVLVILPMLPSVRCWLHYLWYHSRTATPSIWWAPLPEAQIFW
jgi:hypothetical protein